MADASELKTYYAQRASEYEEVYRKPERQADLATLKERLRALLAGHDVLEVACGTGYWTAEFAPSASSVVAADVNEEVLQLARAKQYAPDRVRFVHADAYALGNVDGIFTAGFAGFWLSHVLKTDRSRFLDAFHTRLHPGGLVVMMDNMFVEGSNHPITRTDDAGNTYQQRRLRNGTGFEVLKNFPDQHELRAMLGRRAVDVRFEQLQYYWLLAYNIA